MKEPRNYIILLLCVALFVAGASLWQQRAETDQWKTRAETAEKETAQNASARAALEKKVREAQDQKAALQAELVAARENPSPVAAPAMPAVKKRNAMAVEGGQITPDQMKQWLADANDPAVMRRLNTQAHNQMLRRYGDLFKELNLTPEQTDSLTKLLTDKRQAGMDVAVASFQQGNDPTQNMADYRDQVAAAQVGIEDQIHSLLGDANYGQYRDYVRDTGQSNVVKDLELALRSTKEPLTTDQAALIKQTLEDNGTARITAKVVSASKDFLSPTQHQALQDLRAIQQANAQKRNQPVQILPTAGGPADAGK